MSRQNMRFVQLLNFIFFFLCNMPIILSLTTQIYHDIINFIIIFFTVFLELIFSIIEWCLFQINRFSEIPLSAGVSPASSAQSAKRWVTNLFQQRVTMPCWKPGLRRIAEARRWKLLRSARLAASTPVAYLNHNEKEKHCMPGSLQCFLYRKMLNGIEIL